MPDRRWRPIAFAALVAACTMGGGLYALRAARRATARTAHVVVVEDADEVARVARSERVLFRSGALGPGHGRLALAPLTDVAGPRYATALACERLDFAGGSGVCLAADRGVFTTYRAVIFGPDLAVRHTVELAGVPSRTRVAPNGRLAAVTVFVSGHSYAGGAFSTQTRLVDTTTGVVVGELEQFEVMRDGRPFKEVSANYWGVTFAADSNTFYATLGTTDERLLIRGDVARRRATVLRAGVECPSISPDFTRLAFKKRDAALVGAGWRLAVLDLRTLDDRLVAGEPRSVDDQVAWLDGSRLLYALSDGDAGRTSLWVVDSDGDRPAALWLPDGSSPSIAPAS